MLFRKEDLINLIWDEWEDGETIENEIIDTTRWSVVHNIIFKHKDTFYKTTYSVGATEIQDEGPFEYDPDEIECAEVEPYDTVVTAYRLVR